MSIQELTLTMEFPKLRCIDFTCLVEKLLESRSIIDTSIINRLKEMSFSELENKNLSRYVMSCGSEQGLGRPHFVRKVIE